MKCGRRKKVVSDFIQQPVSTCIFERRINFLLFLYIYIHIRILVYSP